MARLKCIGIKIFIVLFLLISIAPYTTVSATNREEIPRKNILIINSYHKGYAWTDDVTNAISDTMKTSELTTVLYTEYMDWKRDPSESTHEHFYERIKDKYNGVSIDMIIANDDVALDFAIRHREELLDDAPIVFSGVNQTGVDEIIQNRDNITGIIEAIDPTGTINMALEIDPSIKNVFVLFDNSESGISTGRLVLDKLYNMGIPISVYPLNNLSYNQLMNKVDKLDSDSILLVTTYYSDATGTTMEYEQFYGELSANSAVPMYSIYDYTLNHGAIGGDMLSGYLLGKSTADLAIQILQGDNPNEIPFITENTSRNVVDYEQLQRFNIPLSKLPDGSEVINKPFSFYEEYKVLVISTISVFVVLVLLIGSLIFYIKQVKKVKKKLIESNERFALAANGSDAVIWDVDMATDEYYFPDIWYEILGYEKGELNEARGGWMRIIHPDDILGEVMQRKEHLEGSSQYYYNEYRMLNKSGNYTWFQARGKVMRDRNGVNTRFAGSMTDITDRKEVELELQKSYEELEATYEELTALQDELTQQYDKLVENQGILSRSEERYRLITEATNDGICDIDYLTNEYFYSQRWRELLMEEGRISESLMVTDRIHPDDLRMYLKSLEEHKLCKSEFYQCEIRMMQANGVYKWFLVRGRVLFDANGEIYRMAGSITDIELLKQSQRKLHELAYHDALTELPNRVSLKNEFGRFVEQGVDIKAAVLFMDIDHFKNINDSMGHTYGDQLLVKVSERLNSLSDGNQAFFRFGGDEFVILLTHIEGDDEVITFTEILIQSIKEPFVLSESQVHISASIGIAKYPEDGLNIEDLLMNADVAMYKAKSNHLGEYVFYNQKMQDSFNERMVIESHLRDAITNQEFSLQYQPQVNLHNGETYGFEALIRWNNPELGFVSPLTFIKVAEDCQLIIPIGEWALRTACVFIKNIHDQGYEGYRVSVNISVVQLMQDAFTSMVLTVLEETGLSPEYLELEITESIIMESLERNISKLQLLREKGIAIALDDFGTGYSSLSYLRQLPITTLKIDKSFIDSFLGRNGDISITSSIISVGHDMGLEVVAEGVELEEQLSLLKELKCDKVQGYFISKPIPSNEVVNWIESQVMGD
ncbi:ABC transporter substrate binding protein [Paenibacillus crassostreae]|uniref:Diguanylate cyclase n=1 Tax=Paenibacillus crassostreae TaxID=1763538 RepID=A0A167B8H2_9BACL|nr:ABC transporter substrate binding protein [Paenibacillus crassostreae]AOZ93077.1 hypothetical protein LPB68_13215 [Paenibacillus crassostreae]OAB71834.1 hypothetical protein PNBC_17675 [Paenibacillus crassostreae]